MAGRRVGAGAELPGLGLVHGQAGPDDPAKWGDNKLVKRLDIDPPALKK